MLKCMTLLGTRPELIRLSETIKKLDIYTNHCFVFTAQSYDYNMSQIFFDELGIRKPDHTLDVIMVIYPGVYLLTARLNLTGTASDVISAAIFRNARADQISPRATKKLDSVDLDAELTLIGIQTLVSPETIEIWIQNETAGNNVTVVDAVLSAVRIG